MSERIIQGDARSALGKCTEASVHCSVTSPPYWGLRAYLDDPREIGRETTAEQHIENLLEVFREVRRVLRDDGTLWLNYGDAYSGSPTGKQSKNAHVTGNAGWSDAYKDRVAQMQTGDGEGPKDNCDYSGYKPKDLLSMPHRVAMALQADGWYLRSTIIWSKKSPMPESVRGSRWERCRVKTGPGQYPKYSTNKQHDMEPCPGCDKCRDNGGYVYRQNAGRPTTSHEYVFLLTKSPSYFYNLDGCRVPYAEASAAKYKGTFKDKRSGTTKGLRVEGECQPRGNVVPDRTLEMNPAGRNLWTVWDDIKQSNYKGAHFATMPLELALRCVKLGTSDAGCCPTCGAQWAPVVDTVREATRPATNNKRQYSESNPISEQGIGNIDPERHETKTMIEKWLPTCKCEVNEGGRPVILDPFHGSGTTGEAARECGCDYIGVELNKEYVELSKKRFEQQLLI